jgi:hypothetical protein
LVQADVGGQPGDVVGKNVGYQEWFACIKARRVRPNADVDRRADREQ